MAESPWIVEIGLKRRDVTLKIELETADQAVKALRHVYGNIDANPDTWIIVADRAVLLAGEIDYAHAYRHAN